MGRSGRVMWQWAEVIILPLLALAIAYWLEPEGMFAGDRFPWIWLAPVLVTLRYGLVAGLVAAGVFVAAFVVLSHTGGLPAIWPREQFLGGLLLTMICGQFSDLWEKRFARQQVLQQYSEQRLDALTRDFYITRLSHDILEQNLITQPATLRNAFEDLRQLIDREQASLRGEAAQSLLVLLAHYTRMEAMAFHPLEGDRFAPEPAVVIGPRARLNLHDPLVVAALEKGTNAFYPVSQIIAENVSDYLAVIPVEAPGNRLLGLLVIRDMPFLALNEENLMMAKAILQYFADELSAFEESLALRRSLPTCPPRFARELLKLSHLRQRLALQSVLVHITVPAGTRQTQILGVLERSRRGLDLHWRYQDAHGNETVLKLMPLTRAVGAEGFSQRFSDLMKQRFRATSESLGLQIGFDLVPIGGLEEWLGAILMSAPAPDLQDSNRA